MLFEKKKTRTDLPDSANYDWPINYFIELNPARRKELLDAQLAEEKDTHVTGPDDAGLSATQEETQTEEIPSSEEMQIKDPPVPEDELLRLFNLRYKKDSKGNFADNFMRCFVELKMMGDSLYGFFAKGRNLKAAKKVVKDLCLTADSGFSEEVIYKELCHLVSLYIYACVEDKNYNAIILGIGKISDERTQTKIKADLVRIGKEIPEYLEMKEEFKLLSKAIEDIGEKFLS